MRNTIIQKLHSIEKEENIQILLAVESGCRIWQSCMGICLPGFRL